ncbi:MAG: M1 family metallopeptidase [Gemmatimonadota bacterium]|jgi:aminopeptidase N
MNRNIPRAAALVALALPSLAVGAVAQEYRDAYPKNPGIDMLGYVFHLTLSDETDVIQGVATASARYLDGGQRELRLDLIQPVDSLDGAGMTVSRVEMDGRELSFRHEDHRLVIDLGRVVPAGERVQVGVHYSGRPSDGLDIGPNTYGDRTFFSDNWSSRVRAWLPVVDHPYDKATSEMVVVAPSHYQVASNGTVVEESDLGNGTRRTHYVNPVPTATWLYFLGVARFAVQQVDRWEDVPIETWVYWQDRDAGFYDFAEPSKDVLGYYADLIGPYVNDRLANVVSTATGGGMEAASTPAYSEASVSGTRERRWQNVIIHEIAHQWFGNAVTEYHWNDVWLSEGFATYYTLLFRRHHYGHDDFVDGLRESRTTVRDFYAGQDYDFRLVRDYVADLNDVSGRMMYDKGAWILHMIGDRIGADAFDAGIRSYYAEFVNRNASTADLRRHLEEASGQDLEDVFDQWLFQGGIPVLDVRWSADDGELVVEVEQVQERYAFDIEVDLAVRHEDGTVGPVSTLEMRPRSEGSRRGVLRVPAGPGVVDVVVDPHTRLLADWRVAPSGG